MGAHLTTCDGDQNVENGPWSPACCSTELWMVLESGVRLVSAFADRLPGNICQESVKAALWYAGPSILGNRTAFGSLIEGRDWRVGAALTLWILQEHATDDEIIAECATLTTYRPFVKLVSISLIQEREFSEGLLALQRQVTGRSFSRGPRFQCSPATCPEDDDVLSSTSEASDIPHSDVDIRNSELLLAMWMPAALLFQASARSTSPDAISQNPLVKQHFPSL